MMPKRKSQILKAAVRLAVKHGFHTVTRNRVARSARVSAGLVSYHYRSTLELRRQVMTEAVSRRLLTVIADGLAVRDAVALAAPVELRAAALAGLTEETV